MTARKVQPDLKEQMARWDPKAPKVRRVILAALKVRPDRLVRMEMTVLPVPKARPAR